jgi:hypothetical protein
MAEPHPVTKPPARRRLKRWFFTTLKWCRISVLLLCLVVVVGGLFLNHVGLPDWLNRRIEAQFQAKGWDLQYSRLRLRWYRGIVAEDLQLQRTNTLYGPSLFLPRAEFRLNWKAFRHLDLEANAAVLRNGRLVWPLPGTNQPRRTFLLSNVSGELLFRPHDIWELNYLQAEVLGARVQFRGEITNASLIREWKLPQRPRQTPLAPGHNPWSRLLVAVEKIQFDGQPDFRVVFSGDAQNWKTFEAQARFSGQGVDSPWATATNLSFTAHVLPSPRSNDAVRADVRLTADQTRTPWGAATNLDLTLVFEPSFTHLLPTNTLALLELRGASSRWCQAERVVLELRDSPTPTNNALNLVSIDLSLDRLQSPSLRLDAEQTRVTATSLHPATNVLPATLDTLWTVDRPRSAWVTSDWAQVRAKVELPPAQDFQLGNTNLLWPERFDSLSFNIRSSFSNVLAPHLQASRSTASLLWRAPLLELTATADNPQASARLESSLQTDLREVRFRGGARSFPSLLAPLFGTNAVTWAKLCRFEAPPRLEVDGRLQLPPWTNRVPDWNRDLWPTLQASGRLESEGGECRGVQWQAAQIPFAVTNLSWTVPGLIVSRPEGMLRVAGKANQRTGSFEASLQSDVNWLALRTAFPATNQQGVFNFFKVSLPPSLRGVARGNWHDWSQLEGDLHLALTNFAFREQTVQACTADLKYRNRFLSILRPRVWREGEAAEADGIGIDLVENRLFLTNAVGRLSVRAITRCIGPITDRAVAPYVFDRAPFARVEGTVPLGRSDGTENMHFEINGGPFHWQRFNLEEIKATLFWRGDSLALTNMEGRWQGADVNGWANFDFRPRNTDLFNFFVRVDGLDLRRVLRDLQPGKTNKVEGTMSGELNVTSADTHDWLSWQGYGHAFLTNGLLWDTPVFSMFSPILNAFVPGLGNSRARHATATYQITNSVIYSHDLVIRGTALRMNYRGSVDFDKRLDGRMEAELLRDMPAFGFLFSKLLWPVTKLFDYEVSGTLDQPKIKELYLLSRIIMMPLHPLKTLKDFMNLEERLKQKEPAPPP